MSASKMSAAKIPRWGWVMIGVMILLIIYSIAMTVVFVMCHLDKEQPKQARVNEDAQTKFTTRHPQMTKYPQTTKAPQTGNQNTPSSGSTAPLTAAFIMNCEGPPGLLDSSEIQDLCWLDAFTIVATQTRGHQVIKFSINPGSNSCTHTVIDSGYKAASVSCSPNGEAYVTDPERQSIWIYKNNGDKEEWKPQWTFFPQTVAVNRNFIVIGLLKPSPVFVYDINKNFLRRVSFEGDQYRLYYIHITQDGQILAVTASDGHHLLIYDLNQNTSVRVGGFGQDVGQLHEPVSACPAPGSILVCDSYNDRISVFDSNGVFLHYLAFTGDTVRFPRSISVIQQASGQSSMALKGTPGTTVNIYTLTS